MKNRILDKIFEIKSILIASSIDNLSLMDGRMSEILFYHNYKKVFNSNSINEKLEQSIQLLLDKYNILPFNSSFVSGLSGLLWLVKQLKTDETFDFSDSIDISPDFIEELVDLAISEFKNGNFDLFSGGIGISLFLDSKYDERKISKCLVELYSISMPQSQDNLIKEEFNFSLSHGIPSVISFLSQLKNSDPKLIKVIAKMNSFILNTKSTSDSLSLFPNFINSNDISYNSRLAWCYGDLGIASALWHSGKSFHREDWKQESINIMLHSAKRINLEENFVIDAGFCHGTSGIAHIFNRFYKETKVEQFNTARWYWIEQTLNMAIHTDGFAGFKSWNGLEWKNDYSLIEGIVGIGLVLLGFMTDDVKDLSWDNSFLLS